MDTLQMVKQASEIEKKAYADFATSFTTSGIVGLVQGGVSIDQASSLVKQACESNVTLHNLKANIAIFEKVAEYISELEAKVADLEKTASEVKVVAQDKVAEDSPLSKLASIGFSKEEIELMSDLPNNLLTKVASANSQPWELGSGVGMAREKTDPLLEFILG